MTNSFNMIRDVAGNNTFGIEFSEFKYSANLAAASEQTITIPKRFKKYLAIFSFEPGSEVWVAKNETAAIPAGGTFATTTSELNPVARKVEKDDVLHFITQNVDARVGVTLYNIQ